MKVLQSKLKNEINVRTQKDYPIKGIEFIDITPLILQQDVFDEIISKIVEEIENKNIDYIVVPEARGFLFGTVIANKLGIGCVPVRKKGKLPPVVSEIQFEYEKEYGKDILELPKLVNETYENKNFYIIDDIYATGNTLKSIAKAIRSLNGNVVGQAVVIKILGFKSNEQVFSLLDIEEEL